MTDSAAVREDQRELITRSIEHTPSLPMPVVWTILGLLRQEANFDQADQLIDLVEARATPLRALEEQARNAYLRGDRFRALSLLRNREERSPSASASAAVARVLIEIGELSEARLISDRLMQERPELLTSTDLAAHVALATGQRGVAREIYLAQVDERTDRPAPLLALSAIALDDGDSESAAEFLRRALAASEHPSAGNLRTAATLARRLGDDAIASGLESEAIRLDLERRESAITSIAAALAELSVVCPDSATETPQPVAEASRLRNLSESGAPPEALSALQTLFGHASFRPGQEPVVAGVLSGSDLIAILPTGAGKSLTFQLPAMLLPGLTIVVSPLIALMKDQLDALPDRVRPRAGILSSASDPAETRHVFERLRSGELKLLYVAPERLRQRVLRNALSGANISRLVIDEAHCISLWGHDFRPDYLAIPEILGALGDPPVLALTATATDEMAESIATTLGRQLEILRTSVYRPNLRYEVALVETREDKARLLVTMCQQQRGAGIVYVSSRDDANAVARNLRSRGIRAVPYHAGLSPEERTRNQDDFMSGRAQVIAATVAFGMGIDKSDIRFIVHLSPSRSVGAYAQESGRAGRDGLPSRCMLLVSKSDLQRLPSTSQRDLIGLPDLRQLYRAIQQRAMGRWAILDPRSLASLMLAAGETPDAREQQRVEIRARVGISMLARAGFLATSEDAPRSLSFRALHDMSARTATLPEPYGEHWRQLIDWIGPRVLASGNVTIDTAAACDALELKPSDLLDLLYALPELSAREGPPGICLSIPALGETETIAAASALTSLVSRASDAARERATAMVTYARGKGCRHAALASHFGERLSPCGSRCDHCAPKTDTTPETPSQRPSRAHATAVDAQNTIEAVRTLPFPMGKAGLTKLLAGSVESTIRGDRSASYGALSDLRRSTIEQLIESLIEAGYLLRDETSPYRCISLADGVLNLDASDLAAILCPVPTPRETPRRRAERSTGAPTSEAAKQRLEQLRRWRREQATAEQVPAYVVASNDTLLSIAENLPTTLEMLQDVHGIGPVKAARYGPAILAVLAADG